MIEAIAAGAAVPADAVRRAHMLSGELAATAGLAFAERCRRTGAGRPSPGAGGRPDARAAGRRRRRRAARDRRGVGGVEARRRPASRRTAVTARCTCSPATSTRSPRACPAWSTSWPSLPGDDLVLDGEAIGVTDDGSPRRVPGHDAPTSAPTPSPAAATACGAYFFDVLHVGGDVAHRRAAGRPPGRPRRDRARRLPAAVDRHRRPGEAAAFLDDAVARGHEGVMVKALDSPYDAGRRGGSWRKVKPVHTLDLVVLAVEWGHGRRHGLAVEPPPRCPWRRTGDVRDGRQDVQGPHRRAAALADRDLPAPGDRPTTATWCTCAPRWWWRSRSTACSGRRATPAASPCASLG